MRLVILFAVGILTAASCRQGPDYTCVCRDLGGGYGDQQYTIKADDNSIAANECDEYSVSLNSGSADYRCTLR